MLADADKALFLWINSLAGNAPSVDAAMAWVASDYLVPVSLGLTLVALWFIGRDAPQRMRYQIGMFTALTAMALSSLVVLISNALFFRRRPFDGLDDVNLLFYQPTDSSFPLKQRRRRLRHSRGGLVRQPAHRRPRCSSRQRCTASPACMWASTTRRTSSAAQSSR